MSKTITLIIILALLVSPVRLQANNTIRILKSDWCPYVCNDKHHPSAPGYITEIVQQVLSKNDYRIEFVEMNFARGMYFLEKGQLDLILSIFRSESGFLILNNTPLAYSQNYFFTNTLSQWKYKNIHSLNQVKLGIVNGYDYLNDSLNRYIYSNQDDNISIVSGRQAQRRLLRLLSHQRIDTFLDDLLVVNYELNQINTVPKVRIAGSTQNAEPIFVGVSPHFTDYQTLLMQIDRELKAFFNSPLHHKIHHKYQTLVGKTQLVLPQGVRRPVFHFHPEPLPTLTKATTNQE